MQKHTIFMSKILTAGDICRVSRTVQNLRSQGDEIGAVAIILRQTNPEQHRYLKRSLESKIS